MGDAVLSGLAMATSGKCSCRNYESLAAVADAGDITDWQAELQVLDDYRDYLGTRDRGDARRAPRTRSCEIKSRWAATIASRLR